MIKVNLIPESLLQHKRIRETTRMGIIIVIGVAVLMFVILLSAGGYYLLQNNHLNNAKSEYESTLEEAYTPEQEEVRHEGKIVKASISHLKALNSNQQNITQFVSDVEEYMPADGVQLRSLSLDDSNSFSLRGIASDYSFVAQYLDSLKRDDSPFGALNLSGVSASDAFNFTFILSGEYTFSTPETTGAAIDTSEGGQ